MKDMNSKKKVVYFGLDGLCACLELLEEEGYDVACICTMPDDSYDRTIRIQKYAGEHRIPCDTEKITKQKIEYFESIGVTLMIVAGYVWKIPVSKVIRQVNIHPAYLPVGRGSWPMPVAILKGTDSGVTLHKLSERLDEGDILLQERIAIKQNDHLESLMEKIEDTAVRLLEEFLAHEDTYWEKAYPQGKGEYWQEPQDEQRTFKLSDDEEKITRILRAFYGYGSLCNICGIPLEIIKGRVLTENVPAGKNELVIPLSENSCLHCEEWRMAFRKIRPEDKEKMEAIRAKYQPYLSDYTFALLYCWQGEMQLSVLLEDNFYVVCGKDYFFFPIGPEEKIKAFIDGLLMIGICPEFHFCDKKMLEWVEKNYEGRYQALEAWDDSDYVISNRMMKELPGKRFATRRNDYAHYCRQLPEPETEIITKENAWCLKKISELYAGEDKEPERIAIEHFFELGMMGIVVKRGTEYVGFSLCSQKDDKTMQGHFIKCIDPERGSKFYLIKSCSDTFSDRFDYTNMEDDMGEEGLRTFKSSFGGEVELSYTIRFERKCADETE